MSRYVEHYRDLDVYRKQRELAKSIYAISRSFPKEEVYSLTDQILRSSRSIGAQIAEAWGKRLYPKHFVSKLTDADGEQLETQHWLTEAADCEFIDVSEYEELTAQCEEIGRMLGAMIRNANSFTDQSSRVEEEEVTYLGNDD